MNGLEAQGRSDGMAATDHLQYGHNLRVLIVDDDPTARLALAAMLAPDEYQVTFATDAAEVRKRLSLINPDLVICDLVMRDMCGDEFIRWMQGQARWRLVPVIGVTRIDSRVVRADLLLSGADSVLVKPCNPHELRAQVRASLRTRLKYLQLSARGRTAPLRPVSVSS